MVNIKEIQPDVILVAQTCLNEAGLRAYLESIGANQWESTAVSDVEEIIEVGGRICYNSFVPGLNPNVTRVRPTNEAHLRNLIETGHGSVLEHAWLSFALRNVSRVLTHELVRHRTGVAISQESLRYVRLRELSVWIPPSIAQNPEAREVFIGAFKQAEQSYQRLLEILMSDSDKMSFAQKKEITSDARRIVGEGVATNLLWSANLRALRHIIEMRTHPSAEQEIRLVFGKVGAICREKYPSLFGDYEVEEAQGLPWYKTAYPKV